MKQNEPGATVLSASAIIRTPKEQVWEVVKQIGNIADFHPLLKSSEHIGSMKESGAQRICKMKPMGEMLEEVTDWKDGFGFTTVVIGGKMLPPYEFMIGKLSLQGEFDGQTKATFTFTYKLRYGLIGRFMNTLLVRPQFKGAPIKYVQGLKAYMEKS